MYEATENPLHINIFILQNKQTSKLWNELGDITKCVQNDHLEPNQKVHAQLRRHSDRA